MPGPARPALLIDIGLDSELADELRRDGFDARHASEFGLDKIGLDVVAVFARSVGRVLVTAAAEHNGAGSVVIAGGAVRDQVSAVRLALGLCGGGTEEIEPERSQQAEPEREPEPAPDVTAVRERMNIAYPDRIITVPNLISTTRILLVPFFAWMVIVERSPYSINIMLGVIGGSDFLDGWIARRFNQTSKLGAVLDPVADRLALGTALVLFLYKGWVPPWLGLVLVGREVIVSLGAIILGALGVPRFDVTFEGKLATLLLMFGVPFFTLHARYPDWHTLAGIVAYSLAVPGVIFSYVAAGQYVSSAVRAWPHRRRVVSVSP